MKIETSEEPIWFYEATPDKLGEWICVVLNINREKKRVLVRSAYSYANKDENDKNNRLKNYLLSKKGRELIKNKIRNKDEFKDFAIALIENFDGY